MDIIIAARGTEAEKTIGLQRKKVIPFVGADSEGFLAQVGVGLIFPDEHASDFWGLMSPCNLIQSWRGMKILEQVERVSQSTLCACWTAAGREVNDFDGDLLDELREQVGGAHMLKTLRRDALATAPNAHELDAMITIFREKGVVVDDWELKEEVRAGRIVTSPLIESLIRETEERGDACKRKKRRGFLSRIAAYIASLSR